METVSSVKSWENKLECIKPTFIGMTNEKKLSCLTDIAQALTLLPKPWLQHKEEFLKKIGFDVNAYLIANRQWKLRFYVKVGAEYSIGISSPCSDCPIYQKDIILTIDNLDLDFVVQTYALDYWFKELQNDFNFTERFWLSLTHSIQDINDMSTILLSFNNIKNLKTILPYLQNKGYFKGSSMYVQVVDTHSLDPFNKPIVIFLENFYKGITEEKMNQYIRESNYFKQLCINFSIPEL